MQARTSRPARRTLPTAPIRRPNSGAPLREFHRAQGPGLQTNRSALGAHLGEVEGEKTVKAGLVAKGYQDPDLRMGNVDIAGRVSRRSPHFRAISLGARTQWPLWTLDIKNAFLQADGFIREVNLPAPSAWNSRDTRRVWKLRAPAYALNDAPVAAHRSRRKYVVNSAASLSSVGLRFEFPSFDPRMCFVPRGSGSAVGVSATHIDDILGRGEPEISPKARNSSGKRFGTLEVREGSFVHVGMELAQEWGFSVTLAQADFAKNVKLLPTSSLLRAGRRGPLSMDYIKLRQCKLGNVRWIATVSRPGICARSARVASRIDALCGSDAYRIGELVRVVKDWQPATVCEWRWGGVTRFTGSCGKG